MSMDDNRYLKALERVMSKRYSVDEYCIGCYQESAVCIQHENNMWVLYNGERGNRYNEVLCDTVLKGCLEFFRRFSNSADELSAMEDELVKEYDSLS